MYLLSFFFCLCTTDSFCREISFPGPQFLSRHERQVNCGAGEFQCNSGQCINEDLLCNGKADCTADGSDESEKECSNNNCFKIYYRCKYGACIRNAARCDGVLDCYDGSDEVSCHNTSLMAPIVTVIPERLTLVEGATAEIRCEATGLPTPTIAWSKPGGLTPRIQQFDSVLRLQNVQSRDGGIYICIASNDAGSSPSASIVEIETTKSINKDSQEEPIVIMDKKTEDISKTFNGTLTNVNLFSHGCNTTYYGCCPDATAFALGPDLQGCKCNTFPFGCCPDGVATAQGPNQQGCGCRYTQFGCCQNNITPAKSPNRKGCNCDSPENTGTNANNCSEVPQKLQVVCFLDKDAGSCANNIMKWHFNAESGSCSRFSYSGCGGNGNRFNSRDECNAICISPAGKDRCFLPNNYGACQGNAAQWYYDSKQNRCTQFIYSGCMGNTNRFATSQECTKFCIQNSDQDKKPSFYFILGDVSTLSNTSNFGNYFGSNFGNNIFSRIPYS